MATRYGARRPALIGAIISGSALVLISFCHSDLRLFMALIYLEAIGHSMLFCAVPNLIVESAPHDRTSEATGVTLVIRQVATGTGTQLVAFALGWTVLGGATVDGHHFASDLTFTLLFWFFAGMAFLTALLIGAISSDRRDLANLARLARVGSRGGT
jgi:MFS family permease